MGPVSFEAVAHGLDRQQATSMASVLTQAGLSVTLSQHDTVVLVRSNEASRARAVLEDLGLLSEDGLDR